MSYIVPCIYVSLIVSEHQKISPVGWLVDTDSFAGIDGSNRAGGIDVCCECCVLSGIGLCDGAITRPQ